MNNEKISVKFFPYKNHVICAFLKNEIIEVFGTDTIEFEVIITSDRIVLTSPIIKTIGSPVKQTPPEMEIVTNVK